MKRYYNITHLEYLEYMQNGCIRVKDYERPNKVNGKVYCESYEKPSIYDVLDAESVMRVSGGYGYPFVKKIESYSFGTLRLEDMLGNYLIYVDDIRKIPKLMKRLELEGLCPELEGTNMINCLSLNNSL